MIRSFVQTPGAASTAAMIEDVVADVEPDSALIAFAYATMSGCAEFRRRFGTRFFGPETSWLIGIDHGRTQPAALRFLTRRIPTGNLRIYDGLAVAVSPNFRPSRDFHLKGCCFANAGTGRAGMVAGSGNLSRAGLVLNVEMGVGLVAGRAGARRDAIGAAAAGLRALFDAADPVEAVLREYERRWTPSYAGRGPAGPPPNPGARWDRFWIEAGYVTPNRGADRPGNQIDMPRGVHRFFGLMEPAGAGRNTPIGNVNFIGAGPRLLRLGNNWMEKLTLPAPEDLGFGAYDGAILEFRRRRRGFRLAVYDPDLFTTELEGARERVDHQMGSGRRYGFLSDL